MAKSKTSKTPDTTVNSSDKKKTNDSLTPNENPKDGSSNSSAISKGGTRGG